MNNAPYLLSEDRQEYERLLDEALRTAHERPELASLGQRLNEEQLRTMALNASALLTAAAAAEYAHYVKARSERGEVKFPHTPSDTVYSSSRSASAPAPSVGRRLGAAVLGAGAPGARRARDAVATTRWAGMSYGRRLLAALVGLHVRPPAPAPAPAPPAAARTRPVGREIPARDATEAAGAGAFAVSAVLAPVLAGMAMLIFLLVGYILKMIEPEPALADIMVTAGWLLGGLTATALLFGVIGLLVTAVRNSPTEVVADETEAMPDEVSLAREAWRNALLERGIVPFLRDALVEPSSYPSPRTPGAGRIPSLGYTRPDFTSPGAPAQGPRPGYAPPDFTSPDFGGPEHQSE
ncbi:hypothetical protein [Streptomyces roseus]|uniref:hypothetical protein n=1 Tax=Streptomyces roseus TaxID=66430 RepID=UPI000A829631|nr:hypothetical protein [Streptomyces roseus]